MGCSITSGKHLRKWWPAVQLHGLKVHDVAPIAPRICPQQRKHWLLVRISDDLHFNPLWTPPTAAGQI